MRRKYPIEKSLNGFFPLLQIIPGKLDRFIDRLLEMTGFASALVTDARLVPSLEVSQTQCGGFNGRRRS